MRPKVRSTLKRAVSKVVNNQARSLSQYIHVVSGSFITNDYFPKLFVCIRV